MDIEGLGPAVVDQLVEHELVVDVGDLFELTVETIVELERMGEKSATNLVRGLDLSKSRPFDRVLFALGLRHVGSTVAMTLSKNFLGMDRLASASVEELEAVAEIGPTIARSIASFFEVEDNRRLIEKLRKAGLQLEATDDDPPMGGDSFFAGKSVVLTGTMENYSREQAGERIRELGGRVTSGVSQKTDLLVAGAQAGSKLDRARKLGVQIMEEEEFVRKLDAAP